MLHQAPYHGHGLSQPLLILARLWNPEQVEHGNRLSRRALGYPQVVDAVLAGAVAALGEVEYGGFGGALSLVEEAPGATGWLEGLEPARDAEQVLVAVKAFVFAAVDWKHVCKAPGMIVVCEDAALTPPGGRRPEQTTITTGAGNGFATTRGRC